MKDELVVSAICLLMGFGMLFGGTQLMLGTRHFLSDAREVLGVVVDRDASHPRSGERGLAFSAPVVEYRDANGVMRRYQPMTRDSHSSFAIGQTVILLVQDAADGSPHAVRLATTQDLWFESAVLLFMGTCFFAGGVLVLFFLWPRARSPRKRRPATRSGRSVGD